MTKSQASKLRKYKTFKYYASSILSLILGLVIIFPIFYAICAAFKENAGFDGYPPKILPESFLHLDNFKYVLTETLIPRYMLNSLIIAVIALVARILFSTLASYAFAFFEFKGKNFLFFLIVGTMMIPSEALLISNYLTVSKLGLLNTYAGILCVYFVSATQVFMFRQSFKTISGSLREAAYIDGCGDLQFYAQICMPVSKPVITALGLSTFVNLWNTYLWPLLVTDKAEMRTIQVGITLLSNAETNSKGNVFAGVVLALVPMLFIFAFSQRNMVHGISSGSVKG
ncbi:carbohydrate ABC transporter permease [Herbinix luporum]|uniref:carbohydrate ABC transporter permease n=1 Tax=Herbinix luporum TaxID=1679721 RepID=UPI0023F3C132|nr:carbohydrate ABC transporter permease [Herbinix luporum]